jgi:hypothetical protein
MVLVIFPFDIKALLETAKTLNLLHNDTTRRRKCPQVVRDTLEKLRVLHDAERAKMKFGSQRACFARIWARLHGGSPRNTSALKRKLPATEVRKNLLFKQNPKTAQPLMGWPSCAGNRHSRILCDADCDLCCHNDNRVDGRCFACNRSAVGGHNPHVNMYL